LTEEDFYYTVPNAIHDFRNQVIHDYAKPQKFYCAHKARASD